jgi:hypothetical protein
VSIASRITETEARENWRSCGASQRHSRRRNAAAEPPRPCNFRKMSTVYGMSPFPPAAVLESQATLQRGSDGVTEQPLQTRMFRVFRLAAVK